MQRELPNLPLDDNKRAEVETFSRLYVEPFRRRGVATIVLDHVVKNPGNRGGFSIGSERKVGGVPRPGSRGLLPPVRLG